MWYKNILKSIIGTSFMLSNRSCSLKKTSIIISKELEHSRMWTGLISRYAIMGVCKSSSTKTRPLIIIWWHTGEKKSHFIWSMDFAPHWFHLIPKFLTQEEISKEETKSLTKHRNYYFPFPVFRSRDLTRYRFETSAHFSDDNSHIDSGLKIM